MHILPKSALLPVARLRLAQRCCMDVLRNILDCSRVSIWIHCDLVNTIIRTKIFDGWLADLKDLHGEARIIKRIRSAERGNFGDCVSVGNGVSELRLHLGPGYRGSKPET